MLFLIYFPMGLAPYYAYGGQVEDNVVRSLSTGYVRLVVEIMLLLHLIAAFPIITNPPSQFFEYILNVPAEFGWKRCAFRSSSVLVLLFIAESIPNFGSIVELVGACSVTLLTFVFPPLFYMRLCDASDQNPNWKKQ